VQPIDPSQAISVWSEIGVESGGAYSHTGAFPVRDCLRPIPVDCFSIQQNFWILNSSESPVLWAKNAVYLADEGGIYHGTYSFQVYSHNSRNQPLLCEPESNSTSTCRSPFYTDPSSFPQTLRFYAHIVSSNIDNELQMANNFGQLTWRIPSAVVCPCSLGTVSTLPQPWGAGPFELVAVGIDNTATATFRNNTSGIIGPTLIQSIDGSWHQARLGKIQCIQLQACISMLSTQESSRDISWNVDRGKFSWSEGALDQGVLIIGIMEGNVNAPVIPTPRHEVYLYVAFYSSFAYLALYDSLHNVVGIDPQSGRPIAAVPNSSLVLGSYIPVKDSPINAPEEELLILNPSGTYQIRITAGGNTAYSVFVDKATNANEILATRNLVGSLNTGDSYVFEMDSSNLDLTASSGATTFSGVLSMGAIIVALVSLVTAICVLLVRRRRRILRLRPDYDEFR
jgi:hypothetical protein